MKKSPRRKRDATVDSLTEKSNEPPVTVSCPVLAATGACVAVGLSVLVFIGHRAEGNASDLRVCFLVALIAWGFVTLCGRLSPKLNACAVGLTAAIGIVAGVLFASRFGPDQPGDNVSSLVNVVGYVAAPVLVALASWTFSRFSLWSLGDQALESRPATASVPAVAVSVCLGLIKQRAIQLTIIWIILVGCIFAWGATSQRIGFRMITVPHDYASRGVSLLGFSYLHDGQPVMTETVSAVEQVSWFAGMFRFDDSFRYLRAGYAFAGSQLSGMVSQRFSLVLVNFASWITCLGLVFFLARKWLQSDHLACVATSLAAVGIGFGVHINDTTPHLFSFALYFSGIVLIDHLGFATQQRGWRSHLLIAITFGAFSLAYNVAQMLLLVYLIVGVRQQRVIHWMPVVPMALLFRPVWQTILPVLGINVVDVESEYLQRAVAAWRETFSLGVFETLERVLLYVLEIFTSLESPWLLILGVCGVATIRPWGRRILCVASVASPMAACLVFAPVATARGYIVFGASIVLYISAASALGWVARRSWWSQAFRRASVGASVRWVCLGLLLVVQLGWATSHYANWTAPCKAFFLGWDDAAALMGARPDIVSMTSEEVTPTALGGSGTLIDAGAMDQPILALIESRSLLQSACSRLPFVASVLLLLSLGFPAVRSRRLLSSVWLVWSFASLVVAFGAVTTQPVFWDPSRAIELGPRQSITYRIEIGDRTREALAVALNGRQSPGQVEVSLGASAPVRVTWQAGRQQIALDQDGQFPSVQRMVDSSSLSLARESTEWTFRIVNESDESVLLSGWQRNDLPSRTLDDSRLPILPAVEVRVRDGASGVLRLGLF